MIRKIVITVVSVGLIAATATAWLRDQPRFVLRRMTLEEKVGQLLLAPTPAYYSAADNRTFVRAEQLIRRDKAGGIFVDFNPDHPTSPYDVVALRNHLQEISKVPLFFASNFETGPGAIINEATALPRTMVLGATRDPDLAFRAGQISGEESKALGFQLVFAPVVDVNAEPDNPVINWRSFGSDPAAVAELAANYVRGLQSQGVIAVAKHFPGHGDTATDSHVAVAVIDKPKQELLAVDLLPFRAAIAAGAKGALMGHILVRSLDPVRVASISPAAIRTLRQDLGFDGLIITDAMNMSAITRRLGEPTACAMAFDAGVDLILTADTSACRRGLLHHVEGRRDLREALDLRVLKILQLKKAQGLFASRFVDPADVKRHVATKAHEKLKSRIYERGITLLRGSIPKTQARARNVAIVDVLDRGAKADAFGSAVQTFLREHKIRARHLVVEHRDIAFDFDAFERLAAGADMLLVNLLAARKGDGTDSFSATETAALRKIGETHPGAVVTVFGNPYVADLDVVAPFSNVVLTYDIGPAASVGALKVILGETPAAGRLPIRLRLGDGGANATTQEQITQLMLRAIDRRQFPGAAIRIGTKDRVLFEHGYGRLAPDDPAPVTPDTIYDVASLTKSVATATMTLILNDREPGFLETKASRLIPALSGRGKDAITVHDLLTNLSGLPPYVLPRAVRRARATHQSPQDAVIETISSIPLGRPREFQYSCLNFLLLGRIDELVAGTSMADFLAERVFGPLGMKRTFFAVPRELRAEVAPTRPGLERGEIHDPLARFYGDSPTHNPGNAGLFSTVEDLGRFAEMILNGGAAANTRVLPEKTVAELFLSQTGEAQEKWSLGFDVYEVDAYLDERRKKAGQYPIGQQGHSGAMLWIDPFTQSYLVFLSNRTYFDEATSLAKEFYPQLMPLVMRIVDEGSEGQPHE